MKQPLNERRKRRAVASTSRAAYHTYIKGKKETSENDKVLKALERLQPCTGRQISKRTGLENSAVARSLNNLKKLHKIYVSIKAKCKITGVKAQHYRIA